MKSIFTTLLFACCFLLFSSFSGDEQHCLEIKGTVLDTKGKKLDKVKVVMMEDGKEISSLETKCPFKLEVARDHYYTMIISKEGYLPAVIIVDSKVPKSHPDCNFHFEFHYDMIPENHNYNKEYVDFPAAIIEYVKSDDEFIISNKYNTHIKKLIGAPVQ